MSKIKTDHSQGRALIGVALLCLVATAAAASAAERSAASPQTSPKSDENRTYLFDTGYYKNFILNPLRLIVSPTNWQAGQWGTAALVAAGLGALALADEPLREFWQDDVRGDVSDKIADVGEPIGRFYLLAPATGVGFLAGAAIGDAKLQTASLDAFQSLVIAGGLVKGLKHLTHRKRPNSSPNDAFRFNGPGIESDHRSFVSGHATFPFSVASVFAEAYRDNAVVPPLAYGLAGLSAWSRINDDRHWLTDVVAGSALGIVLGKLVYHMSPFRKTNRNISISGYSNGSAQGIRISARF